MSTIATGNTTTNTIVVSGDTTGNLYIQTGTLTPALAMTVTNNQFVGIGTNNPSVLLHVQTSATAIDMVTLSNGTYTGVLGINGTSGNQSIYLFTNNNTTNIRFGTNSTERLRIDTNGNIGQAVTPSAWGSTFNALQVGSTASINTYNPNPNSNFCGNHYWGSGSTPYSLTTNYAQMIQMNHSNGNISFFNTPSTITAGNSFSFSNPLNITPAGNLQFGDSNGGIIFDNSSASTNSTLNDYETGTWTPVFSRTSSAPTVSYSSRAGTYTKVGNIVTVFWDVTASSISGGSGAATLTGLPFTVSSSMAGYSVAEHRDASALNGYVPSGGQLKGFAQTGASYLYAQVDNSGTSGFGNIGDSTFASSGRWTGFCTYQASF